MSFSSEFSFRTIQGAKPDHRGATMSALTEISPGLIDDDFELNKTYPCAQIPQLKKNLLVLRDQCALGSMTEQLNKVCNRAPARNNKMSKPHWSSASLPHLHTASQTDETLFCQLTESHCVLSQSPAVLNPNKTILIVDPNTQKIISVNDQACKLYDSSPDELVGKKLSQMLTKSSTIIMDALEEDYLLSDGTVASVLGKVVEAVLPSGEVLVSVCTYKQLQGNWVFIIENVERLSAFLSFSQSCDKVFAHLFGYDCAEELTGMSIKTLIPSLQIHFQSPVLPKCLRMQRLQGKSKLGAPIPVCIKLQGALLLKMDNLNPSAAPSLEYSANAWAFTPLSGLLLFHSDGLIYSIPNHLSLSLFGYSKNELVGKNVTFLMPGFFEWMDTNGKESHLQNNQVEGNNDTTSKMSKAADPSSLVAGDMATVNQAVKDRTIGRGRIFTGSSTRLNHQASVLSNLTPPAVTSTRMPMPDNTLELLQEAACIAPCSAEIESVDTTEELLQTFALVEPPGEDTYCLVSTKVKCKEKKSNRKKQTCGDVINDDLQDSSFEVISMESRSSSGFCEKFAGQAGSDPGQPEQSSSAHAAESASCFLDLNSDGELVTRALADLDLSGNLEPLSGRQSSQRSTTTCDTAELLRTPPPSVSENNKGRCSPTHLENPTSVPNGSEQSQLMRIHPLSDSHVTSTPKKQKEPLDMPIVEGQFVGCAYHRDGTQIDVQCEVCKASLSDGSFLYCLWFCRLGHQGSLFLTNKSLHEESKSSVGEKIGDGTDGEALHTTMDLEHSCACDGQFEEEYQTLKAVGKGAFGFVWKALRRSDGQEVVVKFINKSRVVSDSWVDDPMLGRVSQEIAILTRVQHHNIVKLVAAVFYLRTKNILHRDIKDENIIIDKCFHIRLIDFGSAAMMMPGKLFYNFCGTLEYCSPEVLQGNPVAGGLSGLLYPDPIERMTLDQLLLQSWISQPISLSEYSWAEVVSSNPSFCSPPPSEFGPKEYFEKDLFPDHGDETLPDDEEEEEDERFALENELQKYL
ncbi:hypothetical protein WMY93_001417 [Mugilogobius chulae]|uniref:non-specific serine/threonine protein kinase n=1 Tax=Mugilogobius chulae TaxID=88201 RepID=A0AAW0Q802_9GOBI